MTPCGDTIDLFAADHSVFAASGESSGEIRIVYDELCERVAVLASRRLTWFQMAILRAHLAGRSQTEIALQFGISQANVHKALFGNVVYPSGRRYGGIFTKLRKLCRRDDGIMAAWKLLQYLRDQKEVSSMPPMPEEAAQIRHWPSKSRPGWE